MKKSIAYNLAQIAVMMSPNIAPENKLEILRVLMDDENVALFLENQNKIAEEEKTAKEETAVDEA